MAKTAKAKKAKKATKAKVSEKKPLRVPMHSVAHFVKMLHDERHLAKFVKAARTSKAMMTMHPATVNFVRNFVANNKLQQPMAAKVVDPCPGDPFECNFRD
jgi:hypothetical protein